MRFDAHRLAEGGARHPSTGSLCSVGPAPGRRGTSRGAQSADCRSALRFQRFQRFQHWIVSTQTMGVTHKPHRPRISARSGCDRYGWVGRTLAPGVLFRWVSAVLAVSHVHARIRCVSTRPFRRNQCASVILSNQHINKLRIPVKLDLIRAPSPCRRRRRAAHTGTRSGHEAVEHALQRQPRLDRPSLPCPTRC